MAGAQKYTLEYSVRSSPAILFNFLTTPSGLAQWFADKVDINEVECTFEWEGSADTAYIVEQEENEFIRYRWDYQGEEEYFEFRITKSEVTGDTILLVTDFADDFDREEEQMLWDKQIAVLKQQLGG